MKKTRILSLLLCLSIFCTLIVPGTRAYAESDPDNGMKISKTATANGDGSYTITLEAFATGSKVITEQKTDIPTDIVLVLDQSGSMKDSIGGYTYTAYRKAQGWNSRNYHNEEYYPLRHNGGSENLWHKLNNNEYIAVSVEQKMEYTDISGWNNRKYYDNQKSLYCLVSGEYKSVTVERKGHLISADEYWYTVYGQQILYTTGDDSIPNFGQYAPLYQSVKKYIYSYTLNGATTVIEESSGDGNSPDTQFYRRDYSSDAGGTRLNALQNAATTFANAVATKAAGKDGKLGTDDDVDHRIAVVGFSCSNTGSDNYNNYQNTEVFIGSAQYKYGTAAEGQYQYALQSMKTTQGQNNVNASIGALAADGATYVDHGIEMANGILEANPVPEGEKRNRVVIVFTDGVPGYSNFEPGVANSAITQANTTRSLGANVYAVGIFNGADATSKGDQNGDETQKANWFMQNLSDNKGTPQTPSYYLSAADSNTLNNIFKQIADNIESGGSSTTLDENAVIRDIIAPQFQLPAGATANNITLETYKYTGENQWEKNSDVMGATATVNDDQVNVTGFDFSENWCGTETTNGTTTYRGNKLVISFPVVVKEGFLGGNDVYTNTSAGVYADDKATNPVLTFTRPQVNVPIKDVTVTATDKNVYLKGEVTADQIKSGATAKVGNVELNLSEENYGLETWQNEYVNIMVTYQDEGGNTVTNLNDLTDDTAYTVEVTVAPKITEPTSTEGTKAEEQSGSGKGKINVFKPELTFKDSTAYYGDTAPTDFSGNLTNTEWKHGETKSTDSGVTMIGTAPTLDLTYTPEAGKIAGGKINTKEDISVDVSVKIGTDDVTDETSFVHTKCDETCTDPANGKFWIHVKTCTLTITKQGGADGEPYVFNIYKDDVKYSEVTIVGNNFETIEELPVGTYTIEEDTGWSWRFNPSYSEKVNLSKDNTSGRITCTNTKNNNQWLNGFSDVKKNIFDVKD